MPELAASTLEGTSIDLVSGTGCDQEMAYFQDRQKDTTTSKTYAHRWQVYQNDPSQPVTFPAIPPLVFPWPDSGGATRTTQFRLAGTIAFYGVTDATPGHGETTVSLEVATDATSRTGTPSLTGEERVRAAVASRLDRPVIHRRR